MAVKISVSSARSPTVPAGGKSFRLCNLASCRRWPPFRRRQIRPSKSLILIVGSVLSAEGIRGIAERLVDAHNGAPVDAVLLVRDGFIVSGSVLRAWRQMNSAPTPHA